MNDYNMLKGLVYLGDAKEVHTTLSPERCAYFCDNTVNFTCRFVCSHPCHFFLFLLSFPSLLWLGNGKARVFTYVLLLTTYYWSGMNKGHHVDLL